MRLYRKTAVVELVLPEDEESTLPLATERDFGVILKIADVTCPAQSFRSPINDAQWRQFYDKLRECNTNRQENMYRNATFIRSLAQHLYQSLVSVSPALRDFLGRAGEPRRLVIQTTRPELHLLPWAAMVDDTGAFLAAGDLSVVQSWDPFVSSATQDSTLGSTLTLLTAEGPNTINVAGAALDALPPEITRKANGLAWRDGQCVDEYGKPAGKIDILHLEAHGDEMTSQIGDVYATKLGETFPGVPIALLWSCSSGAANSWGESPALCLHRRNACLVLSFLAELHVDDASSISTAFYGDVFGPAASRDPETALVRIRAAKFADKKEQFAFANWASMSVYLRAPLDLSALPLNGPRVPASKWTADEPPAAAVAPPPANLAPTASAPSSTAPQGGATATAAGSQPAPNGPAAAVPAPAVTDPWTDLSKHVCDLQPGTVNEFDGFRDSSGQATEKLRMSAFKAWRGNVIRLDGATDPLDDSVLTELNLNPDETSNPDPAERLVWFFNRIEHYGSPLIVWTNADARHLSFLKNIQLNSPLTFLLMYGPPPLKTLVDLVDDYPDEAYKACDALPEPCEDEVLSAAYFVCVRKEDGQRAFGLLNRVASEAEKWLLTANFIGRHGQVPNPRQDWMLDHPDGTLTNLQQQHWQEDYFRAVITNPGTEAPDRESGRAKHELGYLLRGHGKAGVAEMLYGQALSDLEKCRPGQHDSRWHGAMGRLLRDWADLLSSSPERLDKARTLLDRAMAIHSFHGRRVQIAYCLNTAARIAVTDRSFSQAIDNAVDAANLFELLQNWRGWGEAMRILFDCLSETREADRMHSLANLAMEKLERSNLKEDQRHRMRRFLTYEKANAHWIAGQLPEVKTELEKLGIVSADGSKLLLDDDFETEVKRLWNFLTLAPQ